MQHAIDHHNRLFPLYSVWMVDPMQHRQTTVPAAAAAAGVAAVWVML
jgi:hypothetical protein